MRMRRTVLGLIGAVAVCGAAAGKPPGLPGEPLPEGREVDPVAREFYLPQPGSSLDGTPVPITNATPSDAAAGTTVRAILDGIREAILNRLTMPLGTVPTEFDM